MSNNKTTLKAMVALTLEDELNICLYLYESNIRIQDVRFI